MTEKEKEQRGKDVLLIMSSICAGQIMLETLEELKDTWYYKQKLKQATNAYVKVAEKHVDEYINFIFKQDEELVQDILESMTSLIRRIAQIRPDEMIVLEEVLKGIEDGTLDVVSKKK